MARAPRNIRKARRVVSFHNKRQRDAFISGYLKGEEQNTPDLLGIKQVWEAWRQLFHRIAREIIDKIRGE